ncbi:hypothetical protein [Nostoc sp. DSM 114160]
MHEIPILVIFSTLQPSFQVRDPNLNSNNAKANASKVPQQFHQIVVLTVAGQAIALFLPPLPDIPACLPASDLALRILPGAIALLLCVKLTRLLHLVTILLSQQE